METDLCLVGSVYVEPQRPRIVHEPGQEMWHDLECHPDHRNGEVPRDVDAGGENQQLIEPVQGYRHDDANDVFPCFHTALPV